MSNTVLYWIAAESGFWMVTMALMMQTQNVKSSLVFKVIPFILGVSSLGAIIKLSGII